MKIEKLCKYKPGQSGTVQGLVTGVVTIGIVLAIGLIVLGELQGTTTMGSSEYNTTGQIITELAGVPTWIGILITVTLATAVLAAFFLRSQ